MNTLSQHRARGRTKSAGPSPQGEEQAGRTIKVPRAVPALVTLLLAASTAHAALTTAPCLAEKRVAWASFRKCEGTEQAKSLKGKPNDVTKCTTKLQEKLARTSAKAAAGIPCRYGDHGNNTLTDYDTGLMWVKNNPQTVGSEFTWHEAMADFVGACNGTSSNGASLNFGCATFHNWRMPTVLELQAIVDLSVPGCGFSLPCIDPIFGLTVGYFHWSATPEFANESWTVNFGHTGPVVIAFPRSSRISARVVRDAL